MSVTSTRGTYRSPLSSRRKNFMAANTFRRDCTRTSSTLPCWSTARHRKWIVPLIFDDDFIEMPRVAGPGPAPAQPVGVDLPELRAPLPDGFVADHDAALQPLLLELTKAQREPVIQPHAVGDDLRRV